MNEIEWCCDNTFPEGEAGNTISVNDKQDTITLWVNFPDEDGECFPSLTLDQALEFRWALNKAIQQLKERIVNNGGKE